LVGFGEAKIKLMDLPLYLFSLIIFARDADYGTHRLARLYPLPSYVGAEQNISGIYDFCYNYEPNIVSDTEGVVRSMKLGRRTDKCEVLEWDGVLGRGDEVGERRLGGFEGCEWRGV